MNALKALAEAGKQAVEPESPFFAEHRVATTFQLDGSFKAERFKGLIFCQLVCEDRPLAPAEMAGQNDLFCGGRKVVSHWTSRDSYQASEAPFEAALGGAQKLATGLHCDMRTRMVSPWKKVSVLSVILFITTVLGFWKTMSDQCHEWWEPPNLTVESESPNPLLLAVGKETKMSLQFINPSFFTKARIKNLRCYIEAGKSSQLISSKTTLPVLEKDGKVSEQISLKLAKAGNYTLRVEATVKTGSWPNPRTYTNRFGLQVWPALEFSNTRVKTSTSNTCAFATDLYSCLENSGKLWFETQLSDNQGVCIEAVLPSGESEQPVCDAESHQSLIKWSTQVTKPFETNTYYLYLRSDTPKSHSDWASLINRIEFAIPTLPQ